MARYSVVGKPWDCPGAVNVENCKTTEEVMQKAGLDFTVAKCPMVAKMNVDVDNTSDEFLDKLNNDIRLGEAFIKDDKIYREAPNSFGTYRTDYNIPLGMVKSKYTIVQNIEAFNFFDDAIGPNKAIFQTAGCWGNGERIFVSAKLPNDIFVNGDPVENYLVFTNSHDGSSGVKILFTPIRVICQNTLNAAIKSSQNYVTFRHTNKVHSKIAIAQEILGISKQYAENASEKYNYLSSIKMSDDDVTDYLCTQFMSEEEYNRLIQAKYTPKELVNKYWNAIDASGISMRKANQINDCWKYYHEGVGQQEIIGTAWGAANAVSGYFSNIDTSVEGVKRLDSLLYGDKSKKILKALDLALAY